ncbi:MAG: C39 family peptidase [Eubacterium sp.]|nr:C39 family peptidase [Eubacterium sp.]
MSNKLKYILIFVALPVTLVLVFFLSMVLEEKKAAKEAKDTASETSAISEEERINQMLLAEYQKSQTTRQQVEISTETQELTPEDNEFDDMIDETDASEVAAPSEDDLSEEDEAIIKAAEEENRSNNGLNYNGIQIVTGMNMGAATDGFVLTLTDAELAAPHPLFLQYDPRWAGFPYGMGTMKSSACGPTCFAMVITALTNITNASPPMVATYSMNHNYYVPGAGTAHGLFLQGASDFGLYCMEISNNEAEMKAHIDNGEMLVLSVHYGNFTHSGAGHFIVIYGYNDNGFMVNDPASYERSTRYWPYSVFSGDINKIYALGN